MRCTYVVISYFSKLRWCTLGASFRFPRKQPSGWEASLLCPAPWPLLDTRPGSVGTRPISLFLRLPSAEASSLSRLLVSHRSCCYGSPCGFLRWTSLPGGTGAVPSIHRVPNPSSSWIGIVSTTSSSLSRLPWPFLRASREALVRAMSTVSVVEITSFRTSGFPPHLIGRPKASNRGSVGFRPGSPRVRTRTLEDHDREGGTGVVLGAIGTRMGKRTGICGAEARVGGSPVEDRPRPSTYDTLGRFRHLPRGLGWQSLGIGRRACAGSVRSPLFRRSEPPSRSHQPRERVEDERGSTYGRTVPRAPACRGKEPPS